MNYFNNIKILQSLTITSTSTAEKYKTDLIQCLKVINNIKIKPNKEVSSSTYISFINVYVYIFYYFIVVSEYI